MRTIRIKQGLLLLFYGVSAVSQLLMAQPKAAKQARVTNATGVPIRNFTESGKQLTRFDSAGDAIDAHDGEIAQFAGVYYLYGTSYDCGFAWQNPKAPFCGFKVYSSPDLTNWTDRGYLFDAQTPVWQSRCNGNTYGCFRPHVIYNAKNKQYVLWVNVYDNQIGFRVFTSTSPVGPFREVAEPTLAVNSTAPVAGLNNGDHDTFVDDDGTAYIAYTDWRSKGAIVIEQLTADYLSGTGRYVNAVTKEKTEAPGLFKRKGRYYITYSDPNCGYCSGTGTSYRTAPSPLGPWSEGIKISDNSCGGQPSFVSTIQLTADSLFLYGSDLWNNAARNEALANYYWTPLSFNEDGSIKPIECLKVAAPPLITGKGSRSVSSSKTGESTSNQPDYVIGCNVAGSAPQRQVFTATQTGILATLSLTAFKKDNPNAPLQLAIFSADDAASPTTAPLYSVAIPADSITWAAKNRVIRPNLRVSAGKRYVLQVSSAASVGCYGLAYAEGGTATSTPASMAGKNSKAGSREDKKVLKFQAVIRKTK